MRTTIAIVGALLLVCGLFGACGSPILCTAGDKQLCQCFDLIGEQTCNAEGTGYSTCRCGTTKEPIDETQREQSKSEGASDTVEPTADDPAPADEPAIIDEPAAIDEPATVDDAGAPEPVSETVPEPKDCAADEFSYKNNCFKNSDFCEGNLGSEGFPTFNVTAQEAMKQPYEIEFDLISKKPVFCQTKDDYYYLSGAGYGLCDNDKDGWINIEAYRAVTSTDKQIQRNARCQLQKFKHIVYHAEGKAPQVQALKNEAAMVETFRNDGGEKLTELPIYTADQAALPKTASNTCSGDGECGGLLCYRGHCVDGRRFDPAEINTLTKGCIAGLDLNDNQLDDANEGPSDTPTPAGEFGPLLAAGYFMELHYGYYQGNYIDNGTSIPVYHIFERDRARATDKQGLALQCEQKSDAYSPDFWKTCTLKDNQQCPDPNDPTRLKNGLSSCWLKDVERLTPSLFRCTVYENANNYHFHPDEYGFDKNYNRTVCSFKAKLNETDPTKRDIEFSCSADDGNRKPDPSKKEVGWSCLSFNSYNDPEDYLGSCVDQSAEKICGDKKDGETVTYVSLEQGSYGLARAQAPCGKSNGTGACDKAVRVCTGGTWLACNKCNNCPQQTTGQKALCPNGVWPADSCKEEAKASPEVCNGIDDDCDGQIDEIDASSSNPIKYVNYYKDDDNDTYGDKNGTAISVCVMSTSKLCPADGKSPCFANSYTTASGVKRTYRSNNTDCNDADATINPGATEVCDGIDNNCSLTADDGLTRSTYYPDDDADGYPDTTKGFTACVSADGNTLCKGAGNCFSISYGTNSKYIIKKSNQQNDCCDSNKDVNPGQTAYFTTSYTCNGKTSFDYDCDGSSTPKSSFPICTCAKKLYYKELQHATCELECKSTHTWEKNAACEKSNCNYTSNDATHACKLDKTHKFELTKNYSESCSKSCNVAGSASMSLSCNKSELSSSKASTYTPTADDGVTSLIAVAKSEFSTSYCLFNIDGTTPACGQTPNKVLTTAKQATPSFDSGSVGLCSTSQSKCLVTWRGSCKYIHTVDYSSSYYYFKITDIKSGTQGTDTISCR